MEVGPDASLKRQKSTGGGSRESIGRTTIERKHLMTGLQANGRPQRCDATGGGDSNRRGGQGVSSAGSIEKITPARAKAPDNLAIATWASCASETRPPRRVRRAYGSPQGVALKSKCMPFVVKLTGRSGAISWLSTPNVDGIRTLVVRKGAEVFKTYEDAHVAIRKMPLDTDRSGLIFWVKSAD